MSRGRKTKLTPETEEKILQSIRAGNFRHTAALWAGVAPRSFRRWMALGKARPKGPYGNFVRHVMEAEKAAEMRCVALVMKAAAEDARHAEWWLERKFPQRWGRKDRHELTGKRGGPIKHENDAGELPVELLADTQLRELLDAASARAARLKAGGVESGDDDLPEKPKH